jgi:hypothetical protein
MDEVLHDTAQRLLKAAPASVELPAGSGKTHLLAAAVAEAAVDGKRSLVLTHTNAGVDALRRRLKLFGVKSSMFRVDTITSWAFSLARAYPGLAGITVTDAPDWHESDAYVQGATTVARTRAIADVHATSFDFAFVDEYQDCTLTHHQFVLAIAAAVPRTIVMGDRLQAIFGFAGDLAEWDSHVLPHFPEFVVTPEAQRWKGHNEELGAWLLQIRPLLIDGQPFDFSLHSVPGLFFISDPSPASVASVAQNFRDFGETVVLLDKWPIAVAKHASRLGGSYSVMEDISGKFMRQHLGGDLNRNVAPLPPEGDSLLALWLATFAKACVVGLADINNPVLQRLHRNQTLAGLSRPDLQPFIDALESLRVNPTYSELARAAHVLRQLPTTKVYRWEAWTDTLEAISLTAENGESAVDNLARVRERLRRQGRRTSARVASRTLLVKGLEYDHVVIADVSQMRDPRQLYVALSRARKSATVLGSSPRFLLANDTNF